MHGIEGVENPFGKVLPALAVIKPQRNHRECAGVLQCAFDKKCISCIRSKKGRERKRAILAEKVEKKNKNHAVIAVIALQQISGGAACGSDGQTKQQMALPHNIAAPNSQKAKKQCEIYILFLKRGIHPVKGKIKRKFGKNGKQKQPQRIPRFAGSMIKTLCKQKAVDWKRKAADDPQNRKFRKQDGASMVKEHGGNSQKF